MTGALATVDLGTNTVRLLVVEPAGATWRTLEQTQRVTRLGEGQGATGRLAPEPMRAKARALLEQLARSDDPIVAANARWSLNTPVDAQALKSLGEWQFQ